MMKMMMVRQLNPEFHAEEHEQNHR